MLRLSLARSQRLAAGALASRRSAQWLVAQRPGPVAVGQQRYFADQKKVDETIAPGSESKQPPVQDVTPPPSISTSPSNPEIPTIPASDLPKTPPAAEDVKTAAAAHSTTPPTATPPMGTGTATVAPPPPPPPKKRRSRLGRWLVNLIILTTLGYGLGTYYALVSDNWHDFFTEYVPFGEDLVAYFEEREFRKRFPNQNLGQSRLHQQVRGEPKVTIPGKAGVSPKTAQGGEDDKGIDLRSKGPHVSAVEDKKPEQKPAPAPTAPTKEEKPTDSTTHKILLPSDTPKGEANPAQAPPAPAETKSEPAKPAELISNLTIEGATEPVVQDVVKIINDIITVINADDASSKYSTTIEQAKESVNKVISDLKTRLETEEKAAEDRIRQLNSEFDGMAKELVKRTQDDIQAQEMRWKEEYEAERQKLSEAYENKLKSELDAAQQVFDAKLKNQLLEQSIELHRKFASSVRERVESEREGRLAKLDELSSGVQELEKLTAEWNKVLENNLKTQHLLVTVEAVRSVLEQTEKPTPFIEQLAALKEVAAGDAVIDAAIASINPRAYQKGIPTPSMLIDRFRRVAAEVRKAALLPENAGVASHAASLLLSKVMFKKQGLPTGDDVESVLSRAEILLEEGQLEDAAREVNGLQGWAHVLASDWLRSVREVVEVQNALDVIATEARLRSLLVE